MDLKNKVVVITGASSGIGEELSLQFAETGSHVVMAARNEGLMEKIAGQIESKGGSVHVVPTNVRSQSEIENLVKEAEKKFGQIDIFINNAGITHSSVNVESLSPSEVDAVLETNFKSAVYSVWAVVPALRRQGGGLLVFISSVVGKRGIPRNAVYCASKFAVDGFTESLRLELKKDNIRVININPGGVNTPFYTHNGRGDRRTYHLHSSQKIARLILKAVKNEKRQSFLTTDAWLLHVLNFFFPRLTDWAILKNKGD